VPELRHGGRTARYPSDVRQRLVLFDIDGTLLLSGGAGRRAIVKALEDEAGVDPEGANSVRFDGKTDPQIVLEMFEAVGREDECDDARIERVIERYVTHLEADLALNAARATVMPGVLSLLASLRQDTRVVLGLLTGNVSRGAEIKLRAVGIDPGQFQVGAYGSDHPVRSSLPPIAVRRAHPIFGRSVAGPEVVIIGDTPADVTCGQGIGARSIGVATGSFSTAQLVAAGAHAVFTDLADTAAVHSTIVGSLA
jgi:phosphoglycolate phosphatase-like HAD superfamily hydrolase